MYIHSCHLTSRMRRCVLGEGKSNYHILYNWTLNSKVGFMHELTFPALLIFATRSSHSPFCPSQSTIYWWCYAATHHAARSLSPTAHSKPWQYDWFPLFVSFFCPHLVCFCLIMCMQRDGGGSRGCGGATAAGFSGFIWVSPKSTKHHHPPLWKSAITILSSWSLMQLRA